MTIMIAKRARASTPGAVASFSPSRRIFLKASVTVSGGLLLQAVMPPLMQVAIADSPAAPATKLLHSTPTSASRPMASSRSFRRIRRSAKASRRCCRW